jgi:hypothetical protein
MRYLSLRLTAILAAVVLVGYLPVRMVLHAMGWW